MVKNREYQAPGLLSGASLWPGLEAFSDSTYLTAKLRLRQSIEHLTFQDFHHAYLTDPNSVLRSLQAKCLFRNSSGIDPDHSGARFCTIEDEEKDSSGVQESESPEADEEAGSSFSFSRISEIHGKPDESWSKNTSKRRTISLLKDIRDASDVEEEEDERLEATLNSFIGLHTSESIVEWESKNLPNACDESTVDEGSLHQEPGLRIFLTGTASHDRFSTQVVMFYKPLQKVLSPTVTPHLTSSSLSLITDLPGREYDQSPLARKLCICEKKMEKVIEIKYGLVGGGYLLALPLELSNIEGFSRAGIRYEDDSKDFAGLLYTQSLELLVKTKAVWISCGQEHCLVITSSGGVFTWGNGQSGCLGHGDKESRIVPTLVNDLRNIYIMSADCGAYHSAVVARDGSVWTWGRGDAGQLGLAAARLERDEMGLLSMSPAPVSYFSRKNLRARSVACGEAHTLVLDEDGVVHACGWSEDGQTGLSPPNLTAVKCQFGTAFRAEDDYVVKVSAGSLHSCALTNSGRLYIWGNGSQGQLGLGNTVLSTRIPILLKSLASFKLLDVSCGDSSVLCLTESYKAYGWGQGIAGRFGCRNGSDDLSSKFPKGSEVICFQPRLISEVDPVHRVITGSIVKSVVHKRDSFCDMVAAQTEKLNRGIFSDFDCSDDLRDTLLR